MLFKFIYPGREGEARGEEAAGAGEEGAAEEGGEVHDREAEARQGAGRGHAPGHARTGTQFNRHFEFWAQNRVRNWANSSSTK